MQLGGRYMKNLEKGIVGDVAKFKALPIGNSSLFQRIAPPKISNCTYAHLNFYFIISYYILFYYAIYHTIYRMDIGRGVSLRGALHFTMPR